MLSPLPITPRQTRIIEMAEILNQLVRPILALGFGFSVILFTAFEIPIDGFFLGIAGMILGFFFQSRTSEKIEERNQQQQREMVELAKNVPPPASREASSP